MLLVLQHSLCQLHPLEQPCEIAQICQINNHNNKKRLLLTFKRSTKTPSILRSPNILSEHSTPFSLNPTNLALIRQVWKGSIFCVFVVVVFLAKRILQVDLATANAPSTWSRWSRYWAPLRTSAVWDLTSLRGWKLHGEERFLILGFYFKWMWMEPKHATNKKHHFREFQSFVEKEKCHVWCVKKRFNLPCRPRKQRWGPRWLPKDGHLQAHSFAGNLSLFTVCFEHLNIWKTFAPFFMKLHPPKNKVLCAGCMSLQREQRRKHVETQN